MPITRISGSSEVDVLSVCNDPRFGIILDRARELKERSQELGELSHAKFGELIGGMPVGVGNTKNQDPACWVDRVIREQESALEAVRDTMERIASI